MLWTAIFCSPRWFSFNISLFVSSFAIRRCYLMPMVWNSFFKISVEIQYDKICCMMAHTHVECYPHHATYIWLSTATTSVWSSFSMGWVSPNSRCLVLPSEFLRHYDKLTWLWIIILSHFSSRRGSSSGWQWIVLQKADLILFKQSDT